MTAFEEVEDMKKSKAELVEEIKDLKTEIEMISFYKIVKKGMGEAISTILGGLFFCGCSAFIASICLHHLDGVFEFGPITKKITWIEIFALIYMLRALTGAFIRVPRDQNG